MAADTGDSNQKKIARAMSAGPINIASSARIVNTDAQGHEVVLREGAHGLPTTHKPSGAYIMWAGSPYAHLHVMGRP
jgi:hypothetical protein